MTEPLVSRMRAAERAIYAVRPEELRGVQDGMLAYRLGPWRDRTEEEAQQEGAYYDLLIVSERLVSLLRAGLDRNDRALNARAQDECSRRWQEQDDKTKESP